MTGCIPFYHLVGKAIADHLAGMLAADIALDTELTEGVKLIQYNTRAIAEHLVITNILYQELRLAQLLAVRASNRLLQQDEVIVISSSSSSSTAVAVAAHSHHLKPERRRFRCVVCQAVRGTSRDCKWKFPCFPFFGGAEDWQAEPEGSGGLEEQQPTSCLVNEYGFDDDERDLISEGEED